MEQTRPRAAFIDRIGAGADEKGALQRGNGAIDRIGRGERSEVIARAAARAARRSSLRSPFDYSSRGNPFAAASPAGVRTSFRPFFATN